MNILLLGSGGREHAFAHKITQSSLCSKLFVAPGNAGTASCAENVTIAPTDFPRIATFCLENDVKMLVVGPEDPLVKGVYDYFSENDSLKHIAVIGPSQNGAQLEGSKEFAKKFLQRHHIPTAQYGSFTAETIDNGLSFLEGMLPPYVLKADGLAAGKGVVILENLEDAKAELRSMLLDSKFGAASAKVVIEEFLDGIEMSCFVITDGKSFKVLPFAKDYKRIGVGDTGLNTGGMGAVSPVSFIDAALESKIVDRIVKPTVAGLNSDGIVYRGFVFIGLINVGGNPFVIEYNVRMGDPETEVVLPRISSDLVEMFQTVSTQTLENYELQVDSRTAVTVMTVAGGYPETYDKGFEISGINTITEAIAFHAGTTLQDKKVLTNGGRVMAVTALADDLPEAIKKSYQNVEKLHFDKMYYRTDIGKDLL